MKTAPKRKKPVHEPAIKDRLPTDRPIHVKPKAKVNGTKVEAPAPEPEKLYEIPGFPISEGPQSSPGTLGDKEPYYVVIMPAGVFQYVWEMVESRSRDDHRRYKGIPKIASAAEGAVSAFRASHAAMIRRKVKRRGK